MPADTADAAQIYLVTPPVVHPHEFGETLARVLDHWRIACLRIDMPGAEADDIARAADLVRDIAHRRDVAVVIADHYRLVGIHGLDGVHLTDPRGLRHVRGELGADAIVGAFCGGSRHAGMTAGELGADYVTFGPVNSDPMLGDGTVAEHDLFTWWSETIEVPVVAEGGLDAARVADLAPHVDFFAVGREIWGKDDPIAAMRALGLPGGD